ncbi:radical SAM protein [Actinocrinis puniceicyclus]|uniref:Radical SAM protein n=1 Tax=Actinocrinis puniceicyclus TaxID=977794 RepID=A0A8J7WM12_9ACTN|nr:radical SAM protein [Actinocrinis puniceicyclus]MBS2964831.1 radical SAM protein [Actinocrinis puniceicyclus]
MPEPARAMRAQSRNLSILCIQLGFHDAYPDASTLATTYNDGIYYVASFVQHEFPDAQVEMCQMFWGEKPGDFPLADYDYILISALATHFWSNIETLELIRRAKRDDCIVIMGGPHAAFAPYEALRYADYAVTAEGEIPAVQLIRALEAGEPVTGVDNLAYIGGGGELTLNQVTRYGGIANAINPALLARAPRLHWATVSMSRGCPFDCSFCYAIRLLGRRFRTKTADDVVAELDAIYAQTGCNRFYVTDLNFTTRKDYCREIAERLRGRDYKFIAMSRINHADDMDLVLDLKRSGFEEYCLGVESEDPAVLRAFNKKVEASEQTTRLLRFAENDIAIHSAIIFGLDVQDRPAIEATARWCADARIMHPVFVCLAEYPFQDLLYGARQDVEDHRIIMEVPTYQHYSFVGIFPRHMRPSELQQGILDSYEIFFRHAFEVERRPQRRARLKAYSRSVECGKAGMQRHIRFLEELEKPYYTASGTLKEDRLKADFDARFGELRSWLSRSSKRTDVQFVAGYAR